MKEKKIHLRLCWQEEGRPARDFITEEWQGSEFTGFSFCLLYPGLCPEEAHSLKTSRSDQKIKAPRKTLFSPTRQPGKGKPGRTESCWIWFPYSNLGKDLCPPIHTFTKAVCEAETSIFHSPQGWCKNTLRESQSFHQHSAVQPGPPPLHPHPSQQGHKRCLDPYHPALMSAPLLPSAWEDRAFTPFSWGRVHGAWCAIFTVSFEYIIT